MKRKLIYMACTLAVVLFAIIPLLFNQQQTASAQEGGPVNVGELLDESFDYLDGNYSDSGPQLKISGWDVESTGGSYSYGFYDFFKLTDSSSTAAVTLKKRFVTQTSGKITLEFRFKMPVKMDGVAWQLNSGTTAGVKILTSGGNFAYENTSGSAVSLQAYSANVEYGVKVVADISAQTADIYVNGTLKASGAAFRNTVSNLDTIFIKTADAATGDLYLKPVKINKGYTVYERFLTTMAGNVPADWTAGTAGGTAAAQQILSTSTADPFSFQMNDTSTTANVTLSKSFANQTGKNVFEYRLLLPSKVDGMTAELLSGTTTAVKIATSGGNLTYVNSSGANVTIQSYVANVWYRFKIVADQAAGTADIYVNGKLKVTGASFNNAVSNISSIKFSTPSSATGLMWVDDILFYPFQTEPADYVPAPTVVSSSPKIVGMQTFAGWREGYHVGWDWPYRFPNRNTYLGQYDEGNPEVSDWEIKWMVESGVTYFLECWYGNFGGDGVPIKDPSLGYSIHDGFFNAKYKNQLKFAIADYSTHTSSDFRNYIVPFWMEYYFKDAQYMTVNNKPIISIGDPWGWKSKLGSTAAVKAETDYLRAQLVSAGFAGAIILTRYEGTSAAEMNDISNMGIDYAYSYSFFTSDITTMENQMNAQKNAGSSLGMVPTLSVGWNPDAWDLSYGTSGFVTPANFQTLGNWAKNTFMPSLPAGSLGQSMVLVDNWNEYGEGHYAMPSDLYGFQYLDQLRSVFTANPSITDVRPTAAQLGRLNTLFPKQWVGKSWNFDSSYSDTEGWTVSSQVTGLSTSNGYLTGTITGSDSNIISRDNLGVDLSANNTITVRMKNSTSGTLAKFYFTTNADTTWNEAKAKAFTITANDPNYTVYNVDMSTVSGWTGTLKQLRYDMVESGASSGTFSVDSIIINNAATGVTNLALTGTASMDATPFTGYGADKAIDGTMGTYAQANSATPWSLTVDLGSDKTFNQVVYYSDLANHATNYTIDVATAAAPTTWTTVSTQTSNDGTPKTLNFTAVTARYVKLHVTAAVSSGAWGHGVYEFQIYNQSGGTNLAIGGTTSASSTDTGNGYAASKINDGTASTDFNGWASASPTMPQWVQIDFGMNKTFNRVELYTTSGYELRGYQIQYWNGSSWVDCFSAITGNTQAHRTHTFTAVTGSKIRVYANQGDAASSFARVNELEVYNDGSSAPTLSNAGFETPSTSTYVYGSMTNGWTFDYASGVQHNGSAWGAATAPEGVQTAFIQNSGSISQSITFTAGTYTVSFQAAKRTSAGGTQTFNVLYDTTVIGSYTPSLGSFTPFTTSSFTATAGSHTIKFVGTTTGDNTDFIDAVTIN